MERLIVIGAITLALAGFGADRVLHELHTDPTGVLLAATSGPTVPYKPRPDPACASDISSAEAAVTHAQATLKFDHAEARISTSQLEALSDDLTQETNSAENARDWPGVCADIGRVEARATAE